MNNDDIDLMSPAAICRGMYEENDGTTYFGSLLAYQSHLCDAEDLGFIVKGQLTARGKAVGKACSNLPKGRAYVFADQYRECARKALEDFR